MGLGGDEEMRFTGKLKRLMPSDLQKKQLNKDIKKENSGRFFFLCEEQLFFTLMLAVHSSQMQVHRNSISRYSRV